jgi:hypothetical protein
MVDAYMIPSYEIVQWGGGAHSIVISSPAQWMECRCGRVRTIGGDGEHSGGREYVISVHVYSMA